MSEQLKLDIKGLDTIRRDWSKLTKDVTKRVLEILMETGNLEEVYEYLEGENLSIDNFAAIESKRMSGQRQLKQGERENGNRDESELKPGQTESGRAI